MPYVLLCVIVSVLLVVKNAVHLGKNKIKAASSALLFYYSIQSPYALGFVWLHKASLHKHTQSSLLIRFIRNYQGLDNLSLLWLYHKFIVLINLSCLSFCSASLYMFTEPWLETRSHLHLYRKMYCIDRNNRRIFISCRFFRSEHNCGRSSEDRPHHATQWLLLCFSVCDQNRKWLWLTQVGSSARGRHSNIFRNSWFLKKKRVIFLFVFKIAFFFPLMVMSLEYWDVSIRAVICFLLRLCRWREPVAVHV